MTSDARTPTKVFAPPDGAGRALNAADDLPANYVEEELLVSGVANIYDHDADRRLVVKEADRQYTTRILVRYPRDPASYSGDALFDILHPEGGNETLWPYVRDYLVDRGDAYVQVSTGREPYNYLIQPPQTAIVRMVQFDPERYADVDFSDSGLSWDVISQVGRLVRSDVPENPLRTHLPRQLLAGGYSGAGASTLFYVNEGFPMSARMPDGSPIFDGYLVHEPSRYPRVNSSVGEEDELPDADPRQPVQPRDVPAIQLFSMDFTNEFGKGRFRADSDEPGDRFRQWVVPGAYHAGRRGAAGMEQLTGRRPECTYPTSTVPLDHYFVLSLDHLKRWARGESTPPNARPISMGPDERPVMDADGNPVGGVPVVAMDVPTASHPENGPDIVCRLLGAEVPFPPARLRVLYGTRAAYLTRVDRRIRELIAEGWLLPFQASDVVEQARGVDFGV